MSKKLKVFRGRRTKEEVDARKKFYEKSDAVLGGLYKDTFENREFAQVKGVRRFRPEHQLYTSNDE